MEPKVETTKATQRKRQPGGGVGGVPKYSRRERAAIAVWAERRVVEVWRVARADGPATSVVLISIKVQEPRSSRSPPPGVFGCLLDPYLLSVEFERQPL